MKTITKVGNYTKFYQYEKGNKKTFLSFVAKNDDDNYFKAIELLRNKKPNTNGFQVCEEKEENKNFENVFHVFYNIWGQPLKGIFLYFDFENNSVTTEEGKKYNIVENFEFTYKIQKTQIKAIGGIKGFYKFIIESMKIDSAFNCYVHSMIEKI